ncbi:unnamed protein product [Nesidiocoris tenuis]|uniref:Endonuclease/exonuclease/phosphatase domain-containing protein n=1 Tax=Nesidiocoris tenuis TaxID=355587 RepID=A0A6H5H8L8_9HEMI|nr:unnamed protein product [Nesidiocoris tenuis]
MEKFDPDQFVRSTGFYLQEHLGKIVCPLQERQMHYRRRLQCPERSVGVWQYQSQGENSTGSLNDSTLYFINDGSHTRITKPGENLSSPDLTLINRGHFQNATWKARDDTLGSDHKIIQINIGACEVPTIEKAKTFNLKKANWEEYEKDIESIMRSWEESLIDVGNVQQQYNNWVEAVLEKARQNIPYKRRNQFSKNKEWWDQECNQAVSQRKTALKNYYRQPTIENFRLYKDTIKKAKTVIQNQKTRSVD